jgi:hypothetical protein
MLFANLGVNGPKLGATCHGVSAQKTAYRAKVEAEDAAAEDKREPQCGSKDHQKEDGRGHRPGQENYAERDEHQEKHVLEPDTPA